MARRRRGDDDPGMDSLMDALTNVVGILLLILIVSSLGIQAAVKKVVESLPEVTEEQLESMKASRDKTLKNLEELQQTQANVVENTPTEEEAKKLIADLEEFEEENKDLAEITSDIDEWMKKVEEQEAKKDENEEKVKVADEKNRELAAILAQTPEREVKTAKEVLMPNPRVAGEDSQALYIVCKNKKLYFIGDPYEHALKIRDVIDQNYTDLAYSGKGIGYYTYTLKGTRKNDNDSYIPLQEKIRLSRRDREALAVWDNLKPTWKNSAGVVDTKERSLLDRVIGSDDEAELNVGKFRYDLKKILTFFGDGKYGPKDFKYHISAGNGDRIKMQFEMKEDGGWTPEQFLAGNSQFEQLCKQAQNTRRTLFYYYVAADSFETYLQARSKSESFRIPAGWTVWEDDKLSVRPLPVRQTVQYNLDSLPAEAYMKVAEAAATYLVDEANKEAAEFDARVAALVPEEVKTPEEKNKFITKLSEERNEWAAQRLQNYITSTFQTALAATEASGQKEVVMEIVPPEIPHIRVFTPGGPPKAPKPEPTDKKPPQKPKAPSSGNTLILD
ncbi:MAG: hypothetical protein CMO55_19145 [Verrucomicrobiales bacterium]|nr:hypothetical protein [Verrucomicrobiales bacterium]